LDFELHHPLLNYRLKVWKYKGIKKGLNMLA
jgi:hypothetical protein